MAQIFPISGDFTEYTANAPRVVGNLISGIDVEGIVDGFGVVQPLGGGGSSRSGLVYYSGLGEEMLRETPDTKITGQVQAYDVSDFDQQSVTVSEVSPIIAEIPEAPEYEVPSYDPSGGVGLVGLDQTMENLADVAFEENTVPVVHGTRVRGRTYSSISWSEITPPVAGFFQQICCSEDGESILAQIYSTGLAEAVFYFSSNGGANWSDVTPEADLSVSTFGGIRGSSDMTVLVISPGDSRDFIYISTNSGSSWNKYYPAGEGVDATCTTVVVNDDGTVIATMRSDGCFISYNYGVGWTEVNSNNANTKASAITHSGYKIGFGSNVTDLAYFSSDLGISWSANDLAPTGGNWEGLAFDQYGAIIFIGTTTKLWRSLNYGITWEDATPAPTDAVGLDQNWFVRMGDNGSHILAYGEFDSPSRRLYESLDGGDSWTNIDPSSFTNVLDIDVSGDETVIYVCGVDGTGHVCYRGDLSVVNTGYTVESWTQEEHTEYIGTLGAASTSAEARTTLDLDVVGGGDATDI